LLGPIDSAGKVCGIDYTYSSANLFIYLYPITASGLGVCTSYCPSDNILMNSTDPRNYFCLDANSAPFIPTRSSQRRTYIKNHCFSSVTGEFDSNTDCGCNIIRSSTKVFSKCVFSDSTANTLYSQSVRRLFISSYILPIAFIYRLCK